MVVLLLLTLLGCESGLFDTDAAVDEVGAVSGDDLVWTAQVQTSPVPVAEWVNGELPPDLAELPLSVSRALLERACVGADRSLFERVEARIDEELSTGKWGSLSSRMVEQCEFPGPAMCAYIQERAQAAGGEPGDGVFQLWHVAGGCAEPSVWSWMPDEGGSLSGVVDYLANQDNLWRPVSDPAIPDLIASMLTSDDLHQGRALQVLGSVDDPAAARLLMEQAKKLPLAERDAVNVWLYRQSDERARRAFEKTCIEVPEAWQCIEGADPLLKLSVTTASANTDLSELIRRYPDHRTAVLNALVGCLEEGVVDGGDRAGRCLQALAGAGETSRARAALMGLDPDEVQPLWTSRILAWDRFLNPDGIRDHLVSLELVDAGVAPIDPQEPPVYVIDWLVRAERGVVVHSMTSEQVVRRLIAQVPELRDAVVMTRDPWWPEIDDGRQRHSELLVWLDGQRHRVRLPAEGTQVRLVAGLMNKLAEDRDLEARFVVVDPGDAIIWGPEPGLRALADQELLDVFPRTADEFFEMNPRMLVLDLDGTTLTHDKQLLQRDIDAAHRLQKAGVPVTIATGRLFGGTAPTARAFGVQGSVAVMNGTELVDMQSDRVTHGNYVPRRAEIQDLLDGLGLAPILFASDGIHHCDRSAHLVDYLSTWVPSVRRHTDLRDVQAWGASRLLAVCATGDHDAVDAAHETITATFPGIQPTVFRTWQGHGFLELRAHGDDKASAIGLLAAERGFDVDEVVAVGDWLNDVSMLGAAGLGFAMGGAAPEAIEASDEVLDARQGGGGAVEEVARRVWGV